MIRFLKDWTLPLAMIIGGLFNGLFTSISVITPWLIFGMLLLTFTRLSPKELRFSNMHIMLLSIQAIGCTIGASLYSTNPILSQAVILLFLTPTASAAAVITGMLGGSVSFLTSFILLSNLAIAFTAPLLFTLFGENHDISLTSSIWIICQKVVPLLTAPLLIAWGFRYLSPKLHNKIASMQWLSFYLWALALTIVTGKTINFMINQESNDYKTELLLAFVSLLACIIQFLLGRYIGSRFSNTIAGGQSLGQKNTILAIWMAQTYLHPLVAVAPAAYVLWQNMINSYQLWQKRRK
ncbi:MAG: bile acid:sodium symporter family protein [Bacteroidales bacterium]